MSLRADGRNSGSLDGPYDFSRRVGAVWLIADLRPRKRGSFEDALLALARRLRADGRPCTLVVSQSPPAWWVAPFLDAGADVRALDFRRPLVAAVTLASWLRVSRPMICHFHFVSPVSPVVAAARAMVPPDAAIVAHYHVTLTPRRLRAPLALARRARGLVAERLVDRHVAVSRVVADSVRAAYAIPEAQLEIVENAIDVERFRRAPSRAEARARIGLPPEARIVTCVSRLVDEKGPQIAVRAMARVVEAWPEALLLLVGDGPARARLEALAEELGVARAVRFVGVRDDVDVVLAASDVVLVPSVWDEAFGLAAVEGMAAGRPTVVTRAGALPEVVGDAGVIVPRSQPEPMGDAIVRLLGDPLSAARLGRAAARRAGATYGLSRWVNELAALYDRLAPVADGAAREVAS
jgi:glycosyltransferase involved in cell wall biosynthesis